MLKVFRDANIARIRQRVSEGDCPITAPLSIEMLENIVIDLADEASILATRPAETLASLSSEGEAWQPIGTAPKDGTWFIALQDGDTYPCEWHVSEPDEGPPQEGWWDHFNRSFEDPTHWAPALSSTPSPSDVIEKCARVADRSVSYFRDFAEANGCDPGAAKACEIACADIAAAIRQLASKEGQHHGQG